ncbi:hypothetical protein DPMN_168732 [Dreissena polymorpha]|uniref:Uncharacterized protein n=1 Tax=Dreissena polymorpha TaxID=45954 RepID=A0A9D4F645_DREPO|nr:hypothetical protein DPMN_168732 [Dreissena polymorpha]
MFFLHLLLIVREKIQIIDKVEVFQLSPECLLNSISLLIRRVLHGPSLWPAGTGKARLSSPASLRFILRRLHCAVFHE